MDVLYDFYVDESEGIVIELSDLGSGHKTGARISYEEIQFLKDNQYDIYREISYCTFKALLLLVRKVDLKIGDDV